MSSPTPSSVTPYRTGSLNIVFAGTPDFSAAVLASLLDAGHQISAVYCQPDRRVGRGKKLTHGPVKAMAVEKGIPIEQPVRFNQEVDDQGMTALEKLTRYKPDLMIVVAYGLILPEDVLQVAKYGCVNIHASLLPRWRGAAPIQRAIQSGDEQTGVTIMQMDKGLDTGNMLIKHECDILASDTGSTLHNKLAVIGSEAINEFLNTFIDQQGSNLSPGEVQNNELANYAHKLNKAEAQIDWSESAVEIERKIRAFNAWPVSFTYVGKNRLRIWQASLVSAEFETTESEQEPQSGQILQCDKSGIVVCCGDGWSIKLEQVQADGSRAMSAAELLNSKSQWFIDHPVLGSA